MQRYRVALLPGDGIGPEVMRAAVRVLEAASRKDDFTLEFTEGLIGQSALESSRTVLPLETIHLCRNSDAVFLGPVGSGVGSHPSATASPRYATHELHSWLRVYANIRPVRIFPALIQRSPLKAEVIQNVDIVVIRDAAAGLYYGQPRGITTEDDRMEAINTESYTRGEVQRVARVAFEAAQSRRKQVVLADWSKLLETGELWRRVCSEVATEYPDVRFEAMDTDTCVLELTWHPQRFDVLLADSTTGDLLSVQAAALSGTFALHPSAFFGERTGGVYSPSHGTAPTLVGKGFANPTSAILAGGLMLKYAFGREDAAYAVRDAVDRALAKGARTHDLSITGEVVVSCHDYAERVLCELEG
ncbi:3-isopropylmalate dehydrogenase [compost metagenome]